MSISVTERSMSLAVSRRFYVDGLSKSDIAKEFGISRFRVARLIERALQEGFVRIEFSDVDEEIDFQLSATLVAATGLRGAVVLRDDHKDEEAIVDGIGRVAAEMLHDLSRPGQVIGIASTRAAEAMLRHLGPLEAAAVVQIAGAWPGAPQGRTADRARPRRRAPGECRGLPDLRAAPRDRPGGGRGDAAPGQLPAGVATGSRR